MAKQRTAQLNYSELMESMLDEPGRRQKAAKILAVVGHFLGRDVTGPDSLSDLTVADVGCSGGFIADEFAQRGARVAGVDIDVPGLQKAHDRFGKSVGFLCADGEALPFPDESLDVIVFNHIYEHVVDPDAVMRDLRRVLKPTGVLYLGLGNRLGVMEPHYRLPFLSYLPGPVADRYVRAAGRAEHYHERFRTRPGLKRLVQGLYAWDYTYPVITQPERFAATDMVGGRLAKAPLRLLKAARPVIPTYIWVASKRPTGPAGESLPVAPERVPAV